ncbi:hypothetical protein GXW74_00430 [Roseomonas eburnea]|uniref:Rap1a immunity protein domain-containing protein n=1 Tax=Neoroseomonas eburnea TaxID=1346889 RepID=A0A9X9X5F5_9PROT|nr:Rap1a/Tai family immunity protein [Neoroseomonas eburnea]MBR0678941.1 hypothetical protein [Neoroseomonas eburnea]
MHSLTVTRALRRAGFAAALAGAFAAVPALAQSQAVGGPGGAPGHFTTADLARLCGPAADNANALAMRPACYAAIVSVGQAHSIFTRGRQGASPVFCLPEQAPTLDRVSGDFVSWAAANQQYAGAQAAEGLLRFAAATYPCPPAARARRR